MGGIVVPGGDIRQFTVGGRPFTVEPECSVKISIGGRNNEGKFAGDGTLIITQKSKMPGFSGLSCIIDDTRQDLEYIQGLADDAEPVAVVLTRHNGTTYSGKLIPMGELEPSTDTGAMDLEMRGATFEQI